MQDKPKSIRRRPGFAAAMVEAADRVLRSDAEARFQLIAAETKLDVLHEVACLGDEATDQQLQLFVQELADDTAAGNRSASRVSSAGTSRSWRPINWICRRSPRCWPTCSAICEAQSVLSNRHLRLASAAVHAVNRLEEDAEREKHFTELGNLFAKSDDPQLARYGKKLARGARGGPVISLANRWNWLG